MTRRASLALAVTACLVLAATGCATPAAPSVSPSTPVTAAPTETSTAFPSTAPPSDTAPPASVPTNTATTAPTSAATSTRPTSTRPTTSVPTATKTTSKPATTAACSIPASLRGKDLTAIPTTAKVIALTFDGGGDNSGTRKILDTLAAKGAPASFFLTGRYAQSYPASAREIAGRYPVGNHTQDHKDLTKETDASVLNQIRTGAASIRSVTGVDPRPYFRFPEGAVNARVIGLVNGECYVPFRWTADTLGWKGTAGAMSAAKVTSRVLDGAKPGGIVLMHLGANPDDHTTFDADALPAIIDGLRARGYTLVTLERALPATP